MAAPDASPQLPPSTTGNTEGYAPISWTAVAALAVAVAFAVGLALAFLLYKSVGQDLIEPRLLVFPAAAVVLAFIARRQIAGSEGTRAGLRYANAGWTVAVIGGLVYGTYLLAIEFAVRNDADRAFLAFTDHLKNLQPAKPDDPNLYSAVYEMIPPGARASVSGPTDAAGMNASFADLVLGFRAMDMVRICGRSPGEVSFKTTGLVDWEQKPRLITCTIKAVMTTPEGDFDLVVPMRAEIEDNRQRRWMFVPSPEGYVKGRRLTPYGWLVEGLEQSGRQFATGLIRQLALPGSADMALQAYVLPGGDAETAARLAAAMDASTPGRMAVGGVLTYFRPPPAGGEAALAGLFARPDGRPLSDADRRMFRDAWVNPQRFTPAGVTLKSNADTASVLSLTGGTIGFALSAELILSQESQPPPTARAKIVLGMPPEAEAGLLAQLDRLRADAATAPRTADVPPQIVEQAPTVRWRVVRIVSDLKPVPVSRDPAGGPGGGPGGMMGM